MLTKKWKNLKSEAEAAGDSVARKIAEDKEIVFDSLQVRIGHLSEGIMDSRSARPAVDTLVTCKSQLIWAFEGGYDSEMSILHVLMHESMPKMTVGLMSVVVFSTAAGP